MSIVIPARNEERHLPECLRALRRAADSGGYCMEIVVVNNRSTDRTVAIAESAGCRVVHSDAKNLSIIRNVGVRASRAKIVVTIDADSRIGPNAFSAIWRVLKRGSVVGGAGVILPSRVSLGIVCTALALLPIALRYRISAGLFFFRREAFDAIGGFDEKLVSAEDIDFAKRLRQYAKESGGEFHVVLRAWIITSMRKFDTFGDWYFIRHPGVALRLLRGYDVREANKFWYDFKR